MAVGVCRDVFLLLFTNACDNLAPIEMKHDSTDNDITFTVLQNILLFIFHFGNTHSKYSNDKINNKYNCLAWYWNGLLAKCKFYLFINWSKAKVQFVAINILFNEFHLRVLWFFVVLFSIVNDLSICHVNAIFKLYIYNHHRHIFQMTNKIE